MSMYTVDDPIRGGFGTTPSEKAYLGAQREATTGVAYILPVNPLDRMLSGLYAKQPSSRSGKPILYDSHSQSTNGNARGSFLDNRVAPLPNFEPVTRFEPFKLNNLPKVPAIPQMPTDPYGNSLN